MDKLRHFKQPDPRRSGALMSTQKPILLANIPLALPISIPAQSAEIPKVSKMKSKVSFVVAPAEPVQSSASPTISNLCTAITTCSTDHPYGCLKGQSCQYLVQPLCKADNQPQNCISLEGLLETSAPVDISRCQRSQIALILASSHIQLHPTPWLKTKWSKKDTLFVYDTSDPSKVCTDQLYISQNLSRTIRQSNTTANSTTTNSTYTFQHSIRTLGIMLLELCFGYAIEDHKMRRTLTADNEQSLQLINYAVAIQWARDVVGEAGPSFRML